MDSDDDLSYDIIWPSHECEACRRGENMTRTHCGATVCAQCMKSGRCWECYGEICERVRALDDAEKAARAVERGLLLCLKGRATLLPPEQIETSDDESSEDEGSDDEEGSDEEGSDAGESSDDEDRSHTGWTVTSEDRRQFAEERRAEREAEAERRRALRAMVPRLDVLRRLVEAGRGDVAGYALDMLAGPIHRTRDDRGKMRRTLAFDSFGPHRPARPGRRCKKVARKDDRMKAPRKQLAIIVLRQGRRAMSFDGHLPAAPYWPEWAVRPFRKYHADEDEYEWCVPKPV